VVAVLVLLAVPRGAAAQAFGTGPLTGTLIDTEPTTGVLNLGRVKVAPGITITELGWDSNIFDESEDPKDDWVFRGKPDVAAFAQLRWARLSGYAGSELAYYKTYDSERSAGYEFRGRADLTVARLYPFVGGGHTKHRTRPNGEVDVRADEELDEVSGGLAFELGAHSLLYGSAVRYRTDYKDSIEEGVDLATTLNRDTYSYSGGVRTDITPITKLTVAGGVDQDRFESSPLRDADTNFVNATLNIGVEAMISGVVTVGYRDMTPVDPAVEPYRGMNATAAMTYTILEYGRLSGSFKYGMEYSFDETEAYYVETTVDLAYTHRLFGDVDAQVRGTKSWFDYGYRAGVDARTDTLAAVNVSLGYNLRNRTRISLNYEEAQRRSPAYLDRNYDRTRAYLAWLFAF
jgi:hypothetical protein